MNLEACKISRGDVDWIKSYIKNAAPSGNEINGQKRWMEYIHPFADHFITDNFGNAAAVINPDAPFKVAIEAHADEIAWYVHTITKDGFLHVEKNGGSDPGIAPSQKVRIHTHRGTVPAVFGWPAIHTRKHTNGSIEPKEDTIFVDCGCSSREEVESLGIQTGDCITYKTGLSVLNKRFFVGRGQDNKIGGYMIAAIAKLLRKNGLKLPYGLYIINAVQEEVGLRGAALFADRIKPDCAIVTDVTHATHTPLVNKHAQGDIELGRGPVILKSPSVHNKLREHILAVAHKEKIPVQLAVSSRKTGTDTDSFAYSHSGIPAALIALPLRYMHTTVETTCISDIENTIHLLYKVLEGITPEFNFRYF